MSISIQAILDRHNNITLDNMDGKQAFFSIYEYDTHTQLLAQGLFNVASAHFHAKHILNDNLYHSLVLHFKQLDWVLRSIGCKG